MKVRLVSVTPDAEKTIAYCARVSSNNQESEKISGLIGYCIRNKHWSILEQASLTVEIETSRAISAQILRHRSFKFQEFSQRYAEVQSFETYEARSQDKKNRQSSHDDMSEQDKQWFLDAQKAIQEISETLYSDALEKGIAKEQARFLLPMGTSTKLYMTGDIRSWIHYIDLRCGNGTQQEHQDIANEIKKIFIAEFPIVSEALDWSNNDDT